MNGADGERRKGRSVTDTTVKVAPSRAPDSERASSSPSRRVADAVRSPVAEKSRPVARAVPSKATRAAVNEAGASADASGCGVASVASRPHHVAERKAMRARSRSTTMRVATLWTRPAESLGMTFFHSTGETS